MDLIEKFLLMIRSEKGLSKNTLDAYRTDLLLLQEYFSSCHPEQSEGSSKYVNLKTGPFAIAQGDDVKSYYYEQREEFNKLAYLTENDIRIYFNNLDIDPRSIARKISTLRQFYIFLMRQKVIVNNPMDHILAPKIKASLPKILTLEEIDMMLKSAYSKDFRLYTMLEILYATGLRISELITLKKQSFSYYEGHPILLVKGKGSKERIVPLNQKAHDQIQLYFKTLGDKIPWMFPSFGKMGYITRQRMGQLLKELALNVGIDPIKVSPHVLRHAFATHMLQNGADLMLIKEILGHKNLSTSEIYLHVLPDDLKKLVEKYHPVRGMAQL